MCTLCTILPLFMYFPSFSRRSAEATYMPTDNTWQYSQRRHEPWGLLAKSNALASRVSLQVALTQIGKSLPLRR